MAINTFCLISSSLKHKSFFSPQAASNNMYGSISLTHAEKPFQKISKARKKMISPK